MNRAPRLALYALLTLMQLLAPWVHAHTGRETGGFLHLPGLEGLARSGKAYAAAEGLAASADVIVAMQTGVPDGGHKPPAAPDGPDDAAVPPAAPVLASPARLATGVLAEAPPPPRSRYPRPNSVPRAPPAAARPV